MERRWVIGVGLCAVLGGCQQRRGVRELGAPAAARASEDPRDQCENGGVQACLLAAEEEARAADGPWHRSAHQQRALRYFERACRLGSAEGCFGAGFVLDGGAPSLLDHRRAAGLYGEACARGHLSACNNLANLYRGGRGVSRDYGRAAELWRASCDGGHASACHELAVLYGQGLGVTRDVQASNALFTRACTAGFTWACDNLGREGRGKLAGAARAVPAPVAGAGASSAQGAGVPAAGAPSASEAARAVPASPGVARQVAPAAAPPIVSSPVAAAGKLPAKAAPAKAAPRPKPSPKELALRRAALAQDELTEAERGCASGGGPGCFGAGMGAVQRMPPPAATDGPPAEEVLKPMAEPSAIPAAPAMPAAPAAVPARPAPPASEEDAARAGETQRRHARAVYGRSCKAGEPAGCLNLALIYAQGWGVTADPARARGYAHHACEQRSADGCALEGRLLIEDATLPPSEQLRGRNLLAAACQANAVDACHWLRSSTGTAPVR